LLHCLLCRTDSQTFDLKHLRVCCVSNFTLCVLSLVLGVEGVIFMVPNTVWELLEKDTKSLEQEMDIHLEMLH